MSSSSPADAVVAFGRSLLSRAASIAATATWTDWVAYGALALAAYGVVGLARVYLSDCDLTVSAAGRRMPRTAFRGKTVWIVGASSGIGEALALELASRGATLVLSARRGDRLEIVARECRTRGAPEVHIQVLDVEAFDTHPVIVEAVFKRVGGRVDYLVNNAGRSQRGLVERTELSVDREMFNLNVFGVISMTRAALPRLLAQQGGAMLVTTSSVAGKLGSPISATYSATKHALQGFFDSLRMEMGGRNIKVLNVCPGPVQSEITLHAFTEKQGQKYGTKEEKGTNRMPAERCAHLMAAGMWAGLEEVWIAPQPILFFVYVAQYFRSLYFKLGPSAGQKRVAAYIAGESGYGAVQSIWSIAKGGDTAPAAAGEAGRASGAPGTAGESDASSSAPSWRRGGKSKAT